MEGPQGLNNKVQVNTIKKNQPPQHLQQLSLRELKVPGSVTLRMINKGSELRTWLTSPRSQKPQDICPAWLTKQ